MDVMDACCCGDDVGDARQTSDADACVVGVSDACVVDADVSDACVAGVSVSDAGDGGPCDGTRACNAGKRCRVSVCTPTSTCIDAMSAALACALSLGM